LFSLPSNFKFYKMKNLIILFALLASVNLKSQNHILLQEGEIVQVMLNEILDSRVSKVGDQVNFEVSENVMVDSIIVIEKGTLATGSIIHIKKANFAGVEGQLEFSIDYTVARDGQNIRLRSFQELDGESLTEEVIVAAVLLHPLFLVFKGKEATIEKGTLFSAYVDMDYSIVL